MSHKHAGRIATLGTALMLAFATALSFTVAAAPPAHADGALYLDRSDYQSVTRGTTLAQFRAGFSGLGRLARAYTRADGVRVEVRKVGGWNKQNATLSFLYQRTRPHKPFRLSRKWTTPGTGYYQPSPPPTATPACATADEYSQVEAAGSYDYGHGMTLETANTILGTPGDASSDYEYFTTDPEFGYITYLIRSYPKCGGGDYAVSYFAPGLPGQNASWQVTP